MKIAAISDMHGILDLKIDKSNILCICGDIFPLKIQRNSFLCEQWFKDVFLSWCNEQPVDEIYLIAGNHDFFLSQTKPYGVKELCKGTNVTYLEDNETKYLDIDSGKEYSIYGTPWCHQFGYWAFMGYSDERLEEIYKKMPDNVDILLTHDAPYGYSDKLDPKQLEEQKRKDPGHIGGIGLTNAIKERKPKYNFHGHLHSTNHDVEMLDDTKIYNVSYVDEHYKPAYKPLYLEI